MNKKEQIKILKQAIREGKQLEYHYLQKEWVQAQSGIPMKRIELIPQLFRVKQDSHEAI